MNCVEMAAIVLMSFALIVLSVAVHQCPTREEARRIAVEAACRVLVEAGQVATCTVEAKR